jgi:hypothetical protein
MFIEVKDNTRIESKMLRGDPQTYRESVVHSQLRLPLQNSEMCKSDTQDVDRKSDIESFAKVEVTLCIEIDAI